MRRGGAVIAWVLLGCAASGDASAVAVEVAYVRPSMSSLEVVEALGEALANLPAPEALVAAYRAAMTHGDATCPGSATDIAGDWLYGCTSAAGTTYSGVSRLEQVAMQVAGRDGLADVLAGDFRVEAPDGTRLQAGGHALVLTGDGFRRVQLTGTWQWDAGPAWAADGFSGLMELTEIAGRGLALEGAVRTLGVAFAADGFAADEACGFGPVGALSLRDPAGGWYRMSFVDCVPCAHVLFEGEDLGEACVDLSGLRDAAGTL